MASGLEITYLVSSASDFWEQLERLVAWDAAADDAVEGAVREILSEVRRRGDAALLEYTNRFDRRAVAELEELVLPPARLAEAPGRLERSQIQALEYAAERIRVYHQRQLQESWSYEDEEGIRLGQQITALDRVGIYVPGGKAAYPSSVLMNALPARVAEVREIIMAVPAPGGELSDLVLAAAHIAGVDQVITIGGAQAVAALAFGTQTVPAVDKIVGPGNAYVTCAKRMVYGTVGIDMIAGPSEILVVCDGGTDAEWIAMDLFSQAEHDEDARSILVSPDADFLVRVEKAIQRLLPDMERADIIRSSLNSRSAMIQVGSLEEAADVINFVAPEHLELSVQEPDRLLAGVRHAGAIFLGPYTSEVVGDYCAGPNHVLPTARSARFSSPLGVYDFQKRSSVIHCSSKGAERLGQTAAILARGEGLTAHARSAELRFRRD